MILEEITIEDILDRYLNLKDEILDVLEDPTTEDIIETICRKNNITQTEWIETIKELSALVLMGFIHYYDLGSEINLALNFTNSKLGNDIANEIILKIFDPIKTLIEKNYSPLKPKEPEYKIIENFIKKTQKEQKQQGAVQIEKTTENIKIENLQSKTDQENILIIQNQNSQKQPDFNIFEKFIEKTKKNQINLQENIPVPQPTNIDNQITKNINQEPNLQIKINQQKTIDVEEKTENKIPAPKFIFQHQSESIPIKTSGIENKIPQINISKISTPPSPPQKAQIEIPKKNKDIKVVNYSSELNNLKNLTPPPPPSTK
ncbi:MAG: hypothetical protein NZ484_01185 [Patescibacteria group bacterium]|nr:hypothetical protein [Patescibacteria group bacterium]MCX7589724.1 hypothetical protein [Patescibacteria group bacterium]MDW8279917.1 hypothetical protein [bacterium]